MLECMPTQRVFIHQQTSALLLTSRHYLTISFSPHPNTATSMSNVCLVFLRHVRSIAAAIPPHHKAAHALASAAAAETEAVALEELEAAAAEKASSSSLTALPYLAIVGVCALLAALLRFLYTRSIAGHWGGAGGVAYLPRITDSLDVAALAGAVGCVTLLVAGAGVPVVLRLTGLGQAKPTRSSASYGGGSTMGKGLGDVSTSAFASATAAASGGVWGSTIPAPVPSITSSSRRAGGGKKGEEAEEGAGAMPPVSSGSARSGAGGSGTRRRASPRRK